MSLARPVRTRTVVASAFLILAACMLIWALTLDTTSKLGGLLLNLGTEVMGIVLTVAIVDYLLQRMGLKEQARRVAWSALLELDHAIWVWQGGQREYSTEELFALLNSVTGNDPIPPFTQNLLIQLGSRAVNTLRADEEVAKASPELGRALASMSKLEAIRDRDRIMPASALVDLLSSAASELVFALGLRPGALPRTVSDRDPSLEAQERRHFGLQMVKADGRKF